MALQTHTVLFNTDFEILPPTKRVYGCLTGLNPYTQNPWVLDLIRKGIIIPLKITGEWVTDPDSVLTNLHIQNFEFVVPVRDDISKISDVVGNGVVMSIMSAEYIEMDTNGDVSYIAARFDANTSYLTPIIKEVLETPYTFTGEGGLNIQPEAEDEGILAIRIYPQDYVENGELLPIKVKIDTLMTKADISIREGVAAWFVYHRGTKQWLYGNSGKEVIERYEEVTLNGNIAQTDISLVIEYLFAANNEQVVSGFTYDVINYFIHRKLFGVVSDAVMVSILNGSRTGLSLSLVVAWLLMPTQASDDELKSIIEHHAQAFGS